MMSNDSQPIHPLRQRMIEDMTLSSTLYVFDQVQGKRQERPTPALLGLYSLISLWACDLPTQSTRPYAAAWYRKTCLTFTDAIGAVRLTLWVGDINQPSPPDREPHKIPPIRMLRMAQALCFAT